MHTHAGSDGMNALCLMFVSWSDLDHVLEIVIAMLKRLTLV